MNNVLGRVSKRYRVIGGVVFVCGALTVTGQSLALQSEPPPGEYRIVDGRVDAGTLTGWRIYHSACHVCHGIDAVGTSRAPNLVEAVQLMTPRSFARTVLRSYGLIARQTPVAHTDGGSAREEERLDRAMDPERTPDNEVSMPSWGEDKLVRPHVLDLFAYLTARANGLKKGKPEQIKP